MFLRSSSGSITENGVEGCCHEEQGEIGERVVEEEPRVTTARVPPEADGEHEEGGAQDHRGAGVERAEPEPQRDREDDEGDRVEQDLPRRLASPRRTGSIGIRACA